MLSIFQPFNILNAKFQKSNLIKKIETHVNLAHTHTHTHKIYIYIYTKRGSLVPNFCDRMIMITDKIHCYPRANYLTVIKLL